MSDSLKCHFSPARACTWTRILGVAFLALAFVFAGCETDDLPADDYLTEDERSGTPVHQAELNPQPDSTNAEGFQRAMEYAQENDLHTRPIGEIMTRLGVLFEGEPYLVGPLDETEEEVLVCRLDAFDCYTFVDATFAMARGVIEQDYSYESYARHTLDQRYRGGRMDGYCSRLHYFSEWIVNNEERGNVEHITQQIGGQQMDKQLNFMSEHRERYPRFAEDDEVFECIVEMEESLQGMEHWYIPQDEIEDVYNDLQDGDILAFATDIEGLDVTHTGLAYQQEDGSFGLLHASTEGGVTVSPDLQSYVQNVDAQIGIVVTRPQERSLSVAE